MPLTPWLEIQYLRKISGDWNSVLVREFEYNNGAMTLISLTFPEIYLSKILDEKILLKIILRCSHIGVEILRRCFFNSNVYNSKHTSVDHK